MLSVGQAVQIPTHHVDLEEEPLRHERLRVGTLSIVPPEGHPGDDPAFLVPKRVNTPNIESVTVTPIYSAPAKIHDEILVLSQHAVDPFVESVAVRIVILDLACALGSSVG